jgi:SNF2 family DNA or RNA helicase
MEIIDNSALKFSVPKAVASLLKAQIDKSEIVGESSGMLDVLLYWDHTEVTHATQTLDGYKPSSLTFPELPSPILRDYNWPGIHVPMAHQKKTAEFLSIRPRAFCFNEAGTGKTSSCIWAADYLMNIGVIQRVLVICPLSIMTPAWQADIFKTAMHRSCGIAHGDANKRKKVIKSDFDFVVINYDGIHVVFDEIKNGGFDLIIVDEAIAYKNASSKRWKALSKLITPTTWLWMLTGTPASQSPEDAFGLAKLVSPQRIPKYATAWRDQVMTQLSRFKWIPKKDAASMVFKVLQPAIRFTKRECLDLPPVTYQTRIVPLTATTLKYYNKLKTQLLIEAAGEQVSAVNAGVGLSKLLQISSGSVYTDDGKVIEFDVTPRLFELKSVLDETSNKVIVFVPFLPAISIIQRFLSAKGYTSEVIQGSVSPKDRTEILNRFQTQPDPKVLLVQPQSASHGLTATAADTVVFWGPVMSVETYIQCVGRIDRISQKNKMTVVHLQGSKVEQQRYDILSGKIQEHLSVVDLYKQVLSEEEEEQV